MTQTLKDSAQQLNRGMQEIVPRFAFEAPFLVVGRSHFADDLASADGADVDIYDGLVYSSHGYARLARHMPTGTICLFPSKESQNLQGQRRADGKIIPTRQGLERSYIVAAYRTNGRDEDIYKVAPKLRRTLRRFWETLGERSEKHFTQYGVRLNTGSPDKISELYSNGRIYYTINGEGENYVVRFVAPTKRKDGSFLPPSLTGNSLTEIFSGVTKVISRTNNYQQARHDMAMHWQRVSSKLWDERNVYEGEGAVMKAKTFFATVYNEIAEKFSQIALSTSFTGLVVGTLVNPTYGAVGGIVAAVIHTAIHHTFDESYKVSVEAISKTREAKKRLNLDAYPSDGDVADHFKIQTAENMGKECAKLDLNRFPAEEFEFLTAEQSKILLDHEHPKDGFFPSSVRTYMLTAHLRGFSSACMLPDLRTRLDLFQSGLVRFMHEKQDGNVVIYGRYRHDICTDERVRMPYEKQKKFGEQIIRLEYDRRRPGDVLYNAFKKAAGTITIDDMMADIEQNLLFSGQSGVDDDTRRQSLQSIREAFAFPANGNVQSNKFMNGHAPILPQLSAISL